MCAKNIHRVRELLPHQLSVLFKYSIDTARPEYLPHVVSARASFVRCLHDVAFQFTRMFIDGHEVIWVDDDLA
ncbi:hypothetical protein GCM10022247_72920 [Allokutzneria multivorans]|uniref:Uncharacterized protein n=1 Tax=Allokutzneria multivorans TaxID=1142134 RepID=A0ABP7U5M4_9PSEU